MKSWRAAAVLLLFMDSSQEKTSQQLVEVVRSNLIASVSGGGNIDVSDEARLVFGFAKKGVA